MIFTSVWIIIGAVIAIVEGLALVNRRRGDTLTENVRKVLNDARYGRIARVALALFWVWAGLHFFGPVGWM